MHRLVFGVFCKGILIINLGVTECTHYQASVIVGILDLTKDILKPNHYFACDYWRY